MASDPLGLPLPAQRAVPKRTRVDDIRHAIRDIPDFPEPGILFRDLTPVMRDGHLLRAASAALAAPFRDAAITAVAGMEARGFVFGSLVAAEIGAGFVPLRKPGKLPYRTHRMEYALEYGSAALEMHVDAIGAGDRVLLVDDLIATGGTAAASCALVERAGARVAGCAFVVELAALGGRSLLGGRAVHSLVVY